VAVVEAVQTPFPNNTVQSTPEQISSVDSISCKMALQEDNLDPGLDRATADLLLQPLALPDKPVPVVAGVLAQPEQPVPLAVLPLETLARAEFSTPVGCIEKDQADTALSLIDRTESSKSKPSAVTTAVSTQTVASDSAPHSETSSSAMALPMHTKSMGQASLSATW
jgi:hypothetical protein